MQKKPKAALVLGPCATAHTIARHLEDLGYRVRALAEAPQDLKGVELVHPGASLVVRDPKFHKFCEKMGVTFIAPPLKSVAQFENKISLLSAAEDVGLRHAFLNLDPIQSVREIRRVSGGAQWPLLLRALRPTVHWPELVRFQSDNELEKMSPELGPVLIQRPYEGSRRIVQPFARFPGGIVECFPPIDASLSLRGSPLIEICPVPGIESRTLRAIESFCVRLLEKVHYVGMGLLELSVDGSSIVLVDARPGLHPGARLWLEASGINSVAWELAILRGSPPPERSKPASDVRMQAYVSAWDAFRDIPQPGFVRELEFGTVERPEVESSFVPELTAPSEMEIAGSLDLGSVHVRGPTYRQALMTLEHQLRGLWISGTLQTNESYLLQVIGHPWVREGMFHQEFLSEDFVPNAFPPIEVAMHAACLARDMCNLQNAKVWKSGHRVVELSEKALGLVTKERAQASLLAVDRAQVRIGSWFCECTPLVPATRPQLRARCKGVVHSVLFREGVKVEAGTPIVILRSCQRYVPLALPYSAKISRMMVRADQEVQTGEVLLEVMRA